MAKEIRMREVTQSVFKEITELRKMLPGINTDTKLIMYVILCYRKHLKEIADLEKTIRDMESSQYKVSNKHTITVRTMQREIDKSKLLATISQLAIIKAEIQLKKMVKSMGIIKKKNGTILRRR